MFRYFLSAVVLATAMTAFAQTPPPPIVTNLSAITVTTPTGTSQTVDNTLAPVTILGPKTLQAFGNDNIASVLRFQAGIDVSSNGGPGQPTSLFLRGTGSSQTLVMLDGIRINPGTIGGPPFNHILASGVNRVEVVEAPRSALYGTDALGGVISISPGNPPREGFRWGASASGGHYSSRGAGVHAGGGNGTFFGGGAFNWFETAGFPTKTASDRASAFRNQTVYALVGAQNDRGEVRAGFWQSRGTTDYLNFSLAPTSQDYTDRVASLHLGGQLAEPWHSRIILGQFFDGLENPHSADFTHTWRNSLDWRNDLTLGGHHLLSVGVFLAHQHVNASSFGTSYEDVTRTRAIYAQDQMHYGAHRLVLAAREAHFSSFGDKFVWNADYGFAFARDWRVTAGLGTGFRAPTATDLYGVGGNSALEPEYSHSQNVGLYWQPDRHVSLGLNLYRNHVADLIAYEATSSGGQLQNVGSATITGVTLSSQIVYGTWHIKPALNFQRPLNDDSGGYLPRRTRRSATLNVHHDIGRWDIGAHFLAVGPTKDSDFSNAVNAGYVLTGLNVGFDFTRQWRLAARIDNLFDIDYATAAGYANAGRGLYLTLSYNM